MIMKTSLKSLLVASLLAPFCLLSPASADPLYQQNYAGSGNFWASQNDTTGGNDNYATVYDNFTLGSTSAINNVTWAGGFFNGTPGNITAFTISFWANSAGAPGGLLQAFHMAGNASQMSIGGGTYTYSLNLTSAFNAVAGTQYWLSIVPDVGLPPQWGWAGGTGGNGASAQDYFGVRYVRGSDMTFALNASPAGVPDSGDTALMLGGAILLLSVLLRWSDRTIVTR
jgi:hypothetical protein